MHGPRALVLLLVACTKQPPSAEVSVADAVPSIDATGFDASSVDAHSIDAVADVTRTGTDAVADVTRTGTAAPPRERCGTATCPAGEVCCNPLMGICAPPGMPCIQ
jgi:hypothetical protein